MGSQSFQRGAALAAGDAALLVSIGAQYYRLRRLDQALSCFKRAVEADPSSVQARLNLTAWFERNRQLDEAWECLETCLTQHPRDGRALYARALLLHRKGLDGDAETALRDLLKGDSPLPLEIQANACHLLAVVLDAHAHLRRQRAA